MADASIFLPNPTRPGPLAHLPKWLKAREDERQRYSNNWSVEDDLFWKGGGAVTELEELEANHV
jgi:hypothetical protein